MRLVSIGLLLYYVQFFVLPEFESGEKMRQLQEEEVSSHYSKMLVWTDGVLQTQIKQDDIDFTIVLEQDEAAGEMYPEYRDMIKGFIKFKLMVFDNQIQCHAPKTFT